jgi:hypothetical protein
MAGYTGRHSVSRERRFFLALFPLAGFKNLESSQNSFSEQQPSHPAFGSNMSRYRLDAFRVESSSSGTSRFQRVQMQDHLDFPH